MIDKANTVAYFEETIIPKRIKEAIAIRDKEWIEWIQGNLSLTMYTDDCTNSDGDSICRCTPNAQLKCQWHHFLERKKEYGK